MSKPLVEEIQRYLEKPIPTLCLVLSAAALLRTTNFYKNLEKHGVIFEAGEGKEKEREIVQWILAHFSSASKQIAPAAALRLFQCCAADRTAIYNEKEKLILLCWQ